jgi:hypothetical protein
VYDIIGINHREKGVQMPAKSESESIVRDIDLPPGNESSYNERNGS